MRHLLNVLPALWLFAACGHAEDTARPLEPLPTTELTPKAVSHRALAMSEDGWIVSRWKDGSPEHRGDSLIFTGLAMGLMDCADGAVPEHALLNMLATHDGVPYRHPTIQGEYTLDGLLGLWWGIHARLMACPESRGAWAAVLPRHYEVVKVEPGFRVVLETVMAELGLIDAPSEQARGVLGSVVSGWAWGVVSSEAAAYRLHLGYLALSVVHAPKGQAAYCSVIPKAKMPLLEDFCGRPGLSDWVQAFEFNRWEYQHQRATWESPDGKPDLETPALDWLMASSRFAP